MQIKIFENHTLFKRIFRLLKYPIIRNHKTDLDCDLFLRKMMKNNTFEKIENDFHYVKLGNVLLWIENYPYDCFIPRNLQDEVLFEGMPKRSTVLAIYEKIKRDTGIDCKYSAISRKLKQRRDELKI